MCSPSLQIQDHNSPLEPFDPVNLARIEVALPLADLDVVPLPRRTVAVVVAPIIERLRRMHVDRGLGGGRQLVDRDERGARGRRDGERVERSNT